MKRNDFSNVGENINMEVVFSKPLAIEKNFYQLLYALTSFYLVFPTLFFAYGWLIWPFNVITVSVIVFFIIVTIKDIYKISLFLKKNWVPYNSISKIIGRVTPAFLVIVTWLAFSGIGGLGFQNGDYDLKNTLLRSLIIQKWPLSMVLEGSSTKVVYPLNYYLPAAIVGKMFGWIEANAFMFVWSLAGIVLAFIWFAVISQISFKQNNTSQLLHLVLIFCLAGGLDYIGAYIIKDIPFSLTRHIDNWAWHIQYSSNSTLVYWVPHHAIPAWLLTGMIVASIYKEHDLKYLGIAITASILWSPFTILGIFPYLMLLIIKYLSPKNRKYIFNSRSFVTNIIALWTGGIYLLYIASNNFSFPVTFIWNDIRNKELLISTLLQFWLLEFGFIAFLAISYFKFMKHQGENKKTSTKRQEYKDVSPSLYFGIYAFSILILILLPFLKMGIYNDIVMRSSIPALFIFWAFISKILIERKRNTEIKFDVLYSIILVTVFVGFFSSFAEIARSVEFYRFGPPNFHDIREIGTENNLETVQQRAGRDDSFFYRYIGK